MGDSTVRGATTDLHRLFFLYNASRRCENFEKYRHHTSSFRDELCRKYVCVTNIMHPCSHRLGVAALAVVGCEGNRNDEQRRTVRRHRREAGVDASGSYERFHEATVGGIQQQRIRDR